MYVRHGQWNSTQESDDDGPLEWGQIMTHFTEDKFQKSACERDLVRVTFPACHQNTT